MRPSKFVTCFIALMLLVRLSVAEESGGHPDFEAGVAAFGAGELAVARAHFEKARADGLNTPFLLYNLGVVYFRLGQQASAEAVFLELLDTRHAPLARYNLGLVMQAQGRYDDARHWFDRAAGPESPEKVRALALRQLDESKPDQPGDLRGSGYLLAAGGYDDNIAGTPDDASSNQAGGFADLLAVGNVHTGSEGFGLHGVAYTRQYPGNSEFDNSYLSTGASWLSGVGAGELTSTLSLAGSWFGGDVLEREARLEAVYHPDRCMLAPLVAGVDCRVNGSVSTIRGGDDFSAYDGEMVRLGATASKSSGSWLFRGRYQLEVNERKDLATQQEFFSVSPLRNLVSAEARYYVSGRLSLGARGDIRHSRYQDDHRLVSDGEVVAERRTDNRLRGVLLAEYRMAGPWLVLTEWSMLNNRSTIERYDYSRREVMVGVELGF
ncbi:MAG: tetratricopeptide repeat protein [Marinobacter sp.]|uniref:tetratricopeptide repeat protein n=1 Tax=Marinobacter sp. TaxID=50741 RepID=UPI003298E3DF